ncbi:hypothetical protein K1719_018374 [Acacia pycnantha]|nr:hypothetical protein K1719_018374 [Acacia pycnantha]
MACYEAELAEKEYERARNQELVKLQEESSIRQEQAQWATEKQIQELRIPGCQQHWFSSEVLRMPGKMSSTLCQLQGLDNAWMTERDVASLRSQAVTKIHQLFDLIWLRILARDCYFPSDIHRDLHFLYSSPCPCHKPSW